MKNRLKYIVASFIFLLGCSKDKNVQLVPYVPVDYTISLANPNMAGLNGVGGFAYIANVGYKGILIFKISNDTYYAYDRACTYMPLEVCHKISIDSTNSFAAVCACCTSKFAMDGGLVLSNPATRGLTRYKVEYLSSLYSLRISNEN